MMVTKAVHRDILKVDPQSRYQYVLHPGMT